MATRVERRSTILTIVPGRPEVRKVTTSGRIIPKRLLDGVVEVYDIFGRLRSLPQTFDDPIVRPEIRLSWNLPKPLGPAQYPASYDYAYQTLVRRNREIIARLRPTITSYSDNNPNDGPNQYEICLQGLSQGEVENCGVPIFLSADLTRPIPPPVPPDEFVPPDLSLSATVIGTPPGSAIIGLSWLVAGTPQDSGFTLSGPGAPTEAFGPEARSTTVTVTEGGSLTWTISAILEEGPASDTVTLDVELGEIETPVTPIPSISLIAIVDDDTVRLSTQQLPNPTYTWIRDGVTLNTTTVPRYDDTGVNPGTYSYVVSAEFDFENVATGETTRETATASAIVVVEEDILGDPRVLLAIFVEERLGTFVLTATYRLELPDGTEVPIPDDTRYIWTKDGSPLGNTTVPTVTDNNPTPGVRHTYCVTVGGETRCAEAELGVLSVSLSATQQGRQRGDTQARVLLQWSVSGGAPTGFVLTGAGITGELAQGATNRDHQVAVDAPGEYDWSITATFTNGRTATDTASIILVAPEGLVPCPPVGLAINTDTVVPMVGVTSAIANWAADGSEGCGVVERFIYQIEADINYQIQFDVLGFEGSIPAGRRTLVIEGEGELTGIRVAFGSVSFDNNTSTFSEEVEVTLTPTSQAQANVGLPTRTVYRAYGGDTGPLTFATQGSVAVPRGVVVYSTSLVTRRGLPFGLTLSRVITAVRIRIAAANSSGRSADSAHSRGFGGREDALRFDLSLTFVRTDGEFALFTGTIPPRLRDTYPDGTQVFGFGFRWDPDGTGMRDYTTADDTRYGTSSVSVSGDIRIPHPGGTVRYQTVVIAITSVGNVAGEVTGIVVGESNIVTVTR